MDFKELEEYGDVIESYLFNKMNKQELDAFKSLMSTNKELEKEVKERSALMFVTQNESLYQIKDVLDRVVADNPISTEPDSPPKYNWKFIIGLLAIIMVGAFFFIRNSAKNEALRLRKVAIESTQPFDNIFNLETENQTILYKGMDLYEKRAYSKAIPRLEEALDVQKDENQKAFIRFYLGLCHMYVGDEEKSKYYLQPLVESDFELKDYILDLPIY